MRITIIPNDQFVYLDGAAYHVPSLADIAARIHAIQWDGTKGHIEYVQHEDFFTPNAEISNLDAYQQYIGEALALVENAPPVPLMPLDVFAYKLRQQYAFTQTKTVDYGVQYSDPVSIGLMTSLIALYDKGVLTGQVNYKGPNGFIKLTKEQLEAMSFQIFARVQLAFNTEKAVLEDIQVGTITSHQQITETFLAAMA